MYQKQAVEDFDWPCSRRDAHGPHEDWVDRHPFQGDKKRCSDCKRAATSPHHQPIDCPGVRAHPATMSGSVYVFGVSNE